MTFSGDTVVVGAESEDGVGTNRGAAYVFERDQGGAGNWGQVTKLTAGEPLTPLKNIPELETPPEPEEADVETHALGGRRVPAQRIDSTPKQSVTEEQSHPDCRQQEQEEAEKNLPPSSSGTSPGARAKSS